MEIGEKGGLQGQGRLAGFVVEINETQFQVFEMGGIPGHRDGGISKERLPVCPFLTAHGAHFKGI